MASTDPFHLAELRLLPAAVPLEGPPLEWYMAVAPAAVVFGRIVTLYFPDVARWRIPPECESVVGVLRQLGRIDEAYAVQAAWDDLQKSDDGRAVAAICDVATDGVFLGESFLWELASDADLDDKLRVLYAGKECLPALLAAAGYYRAQTGGAVGPRLRSLLASLLPEDVPLDGPPKEWFMAVAPAIEALGRIVAHYIPDLAAQHIPSDCESVIATLQYLGRDYVVPSFQAAWDDLCMNDDGRAVVAVCDAAMDGGVLLGSRYTARLAADAGLEDKLRVLYAGKEFLPVLLAAARYYRAQSKRTAPAVGGGDGGGSAGACGGGGCDSDKGGSSAGATGGAGCV